MDLIKAVEEKQNVFRFMKESFSALRMQAFARHLQFARNLTELVLNVYSLLIAHAL